ncbi:hypothetical protein KBC14_01080 [Candidatus Woesebacteria bacterium]|nr:hypothetical protein [Candidatus Woesebacteria bacterium]
MDRKFGLILGVCVVGLFALIVALNFFTAPRPKDESSSSPIPTRASITRTGNNFTQPKMSESMRKTLQQEQTKLQQSTPLTKEQVESLQKLKSTLRTKPEDNDDFAISYSEDLDQFFVQLKSEGASKKLEEYLSKDPVLVSTYKNDLYDFFQTSTTPPQKTINQATQKYDQYQEEKYQTEQNNNSINKESDLFPTVKSEDETVKNTIRQVQSLNNLFKLFTTNRIQSRPGPSSTPRGVTIPSSNQSVPSSLDALFAEAGQRVGTPPPLIKAVMAHECGVLLSETPSNILAWSQAGAGLPITHKCFDGGVAKGDGLDLGPMQFYIPRYFEVYSQSVNQFGNYNRPKPYVENIVDSVYASAYKLKLDSESSDSNFSCLEVKRASWCYACGCSRYDNGNLGAYGCRFAPGLFQYLWGYYTIGRPATNNPPC